MVHKKKRKRDHHHDEREIYSSNPENPFRFPSEAPKNLLESTQGPLKELRSVPTEPLDPPEHLEKAWDCPKVLLEPPVEQWDPPLCSLQELR